MFKFGAWHMYRGKSPGQAYTIANGGEAYGLYVVSLGGYTKDPSELPASRKADWKLTGFPTP